MVHSNCEVMVHKFHISLNSAGKIVVGYANYSNFAATTLNSLLKHVRKEQNFRQ